VKGERVDVARHTTGIAPRVRRDKRDAHLANPTDGAG
jgi:hypothetical protein